MCTRIAASDTREWCMLTWPVKAWRNSVLAQSCSPFAPTLSGDRPAGMCNDQHQASLSRKLPVLYCLTLEAPLQGPYAAAQQCFEPVTSLFILTSHVLKHAERSPEKVAHL